MSDGKVSKFFGSLAEAYSKKGMQTLIQFVANLDPDTVTEAQIDALLKELKDKSIELAKAHDQYEVEQGKADVIEKLYKQRLLAADNMKKNMEAAIDETTKSAIQASLLKQIKLIEDMKPDFDREMAEAADAKQLYEDMKEDIETFNTVLNKVRASAEQAKRNMQSSEMHKKRAEMHAATAEAASGLKTSVDSFAIAIDAMNNVAKKNNIAADAAEIRAKLLTPTKDEEEDPIIAAAMAEVSGEKATSAMSIEERLAALKK